MKFPGFSGIFCNFPAIMSGVNIGFGKSRKIPENYLLFATLAYPRGEGDEMQNAKE